MDLFEYIALCTSDAKRNGDIRHLRRDIIDAATVNDDGIAELVVVEHKEARSGKDCFLFVESTLLELLRAYIHKLAPATTSEGLQCPYAFSTMQGDNLTSTVSTLCNIVLLHVFKLQVGIAYLRQSSRCVT